MGGRHKAEAWIQEQWNTRPNAYCEYEAGPRTHQLQLGGGDPGRQFRKPVHLRNAWCNGANLTSGKANASAKFFRRDFAGDWRTLNRLHTKVWNAM